MNVEKEFANEEKVDINKKNGRIKQKKKNVEFSVV